MQSLIQLIQNYVGPISQVLNIVLVILGVVFAGLQLIKALQAFNKNQIKDVGKHLAYAIGVIIIAAIGIGGIRKIAQSVGNDIGNGNFQLDNSDAFGTASAEHIFNGYVK